MRWIALALVPLVVGCTKVASNQIEPAKTSDVAYAAKNCKQLERDAGNIYGELSARSMANDNQTGEFGADNATVISHLKGQLSTIMATMANKGCPI